MFLRDYVLFILSNYTLYTVEDVYNMSLSEINLLRQAVEIREEREIQKIHLVNWLSRVVNATNKRGDKYLYTSFEDFYKPNKANSSNDLKNSKRKVDDKLSSKRSQEDLYKIALNLRELKERKSKT